MSESAAEPTAAPAAAPAAPAEKPPIGRGRKITVWILIVLATIIALVAILTTWVRRQMLNDNSWRKASQNLIQDQEIRDSLSVYIVNQIYENVDVAAALKAKLPENLKPLAEPLAGSLRQRASNGISTILAQPRVEQLFVNASSLAHDKLVNVLEDNTGHGISTGNGTVTLDLHEVIMNVGQKLGIPQQALDKLSAQAGVITIMKSDQLSTAQNGVHALKVLSVWLAIAVLALYALAVFLARGIRRQTIRNIGWGLLIVGIIVLIVRRVMGNYIVDQLSSPGYERSTHNAWLIGTSILGEIGKAILMYGLITVLGAMLAGPTRIGTKVRGWLAPTLNDHQGVVWASFGFIFLLAIWWAPTHALHTWWGIVLLGGLLALGIWALRQQTLKEFPSTTAAAPPPACSAGLSLRPQWAPGRSPPQRS